jgi:hypothetical protein
MGREAEKKGGRALCGKGAVTSKGERTREERGRKEEVRVLGTKERFSLAGKWDTRQQSVEASMKCKTETKKMRARRWGEYGWSPKLMRRRDVDVIMEASMRQDPRPAEENNDGGVHAEAHGGGEQV